MLKRSLQILLALGMLLVGAAAFWYLLNSQTVPSLPSQAAAPSTNRLSPELSRQLAERLRRLRSEARQPALSASIARDGALVWSLAMGYADIEDRRIATANTRFPIGSVSKPLTAVAAMALVEQDKLGLDTDIRSYLPEFPAKEHALNLRQLLSHQAGIRHYKLAWSPPFFSEMASKAHYSNVIDSLRRFDRDPLLFAPDTDFYYSTYGYTLASAVMQKAAGQGFLDYMRAALFAPLAMSHTGPDDTKAKTRQRASDYLATFGNQVLPAPLADSSAKWAGGGFLSTPDDLVRFGDALLAGQLIDQSTVELMFEARTLADGRPNGQSYGLGWRIGRMSVPAGSDDFVRIVHHGGTSVGAQCVLLLVPVAPLAVAISGNANIGGSGKLLQAAADLARIAMQSTAASNKPVADPHLGDFSL